MSNEGTMTTSVLSAPTPRVPAIQPVWLLDQIVKAARQRGASEPTAPRLVSWVSAYVLWHGKCHLHSADRAAWSRFLEHADPTEKQLLSAPKWARSTLELLYCVFS